MHAGGHERKLMTFAFPCSACLLKMVLFILSRIKSQVPIDSKATHSALQKGDAFDMATLLCSVLLGSGYDAYVIHGRAKKNIAGNDQCQQACPSSEVFMGARQNNTAELEGMCLNGMDSETVPAGEHVSISQPSDGQPEGGLDGRKAEATSGVDIAHAEAAALGADSADVETARWPTLSVATRGDPAVVEKPAPLSNAETAGPGSGVADDGESLSGRNLGPNETQDTAVKPGRTAPSGSTDAESVHAWVLVKANRKVASTLPLYI